MLEIAPSPPGCENLNLQMSLGEANCPRVGTTDLVDYLEKQLICSLTLKTQHVLGT